MTALRATACCLVVLALSACGSNAAQERRTAVNTYLDDVGRAQVDLSGQLAQIDAALAAFSLREVSSKEDAALRRGRTTVQRTIASVRKVHVPADARVLNGLVLQRLVLQRDLLDELLVTSADERRLAASIPVLQLASAQLRSDFTAIGSQRVPQGSSNDLLNRYGAAFARYGAALEPIVPMVVPAKKPSLLAPLLRTEHDGLARSVVLSRQIQAALKRRDVKTANAAVHTLLTIAATLNGAGTQKAEAAAADAYNARIRRITRLGASIAREHARLVRVVG